MKQEEAEKLARDVRARYDGFSYNEDVITLCDYILSGDMKREIENAALLKVAIRCEEAARSLKKDDVRSGKEAYLVVASALRSIIQPPAQKENGE